jgi:opacity protein-like surface antigen
MKKTTLIIGFLLFTFSVFSQEIADKTIGLRFGDDNGFGAEVSFQKALKTNNRLEVGLAWRSNKTYNAYKLTGIYQWIFEMDGNFNWYVGAGAGLGSWNLKGNNSGSDGTFLLATGDIGIEYKFDFPLLLSLDFRPEIGFADFNNDLGLDIALGVRYVF